MNFTGTYELARWSEHAWVGENGKPCNITAGYWHAMRRAEHLENECQPNNPLQPSAKVANMSGPEFRADTCGLRDFGATSEVELGHSECHE